MDLNVLFFEGEYKTDVLHSYIELVLPHIISVFEIIGIFVVCWAGIYALWEFFQNIFMKKAFDLQSDFARGLALGLEFKMAAEILKTVLIQSLDELYVLGAVILIRALLSVLIHFEISPHKRADKKTRQNQDSSEQK